MRSTSAASPDGPAAGGSVAHAVIRYFREFRVLRETGREYWGIQIVNFLDCVRSRKTPNADIEQGHRSVLLCHLANIAYRVGHTLRCDPRNGHIVADKAAQALWGRTYEKGWEPEGYAAAIRG